MVIRIQIDIWIVSVVSILWILIPVTHLDCGTHVLWFVSVLTVWILSPSPAYEDTEHALLSGDEFHDKNLLFPDFVTVS